MILSGVAAFSDKKTCKNLQHSKKHVNFTAAKLKLFVYEAIPHTLTSGTVTQQPDGKRVTYSIPSMPGSSGSPVVDDRGRLVAVNFAKSNGSDNFNFGVPLIRIVTFLK